MKAVLLDGLGTLVRLAAPWPVLVRELEEKYGIEIALEEAELAFRAEMSYYRAHHHEGYDQQTLAELRDRCAAVLHAALPWAAAHAVDARQLTDVMLGALRFSAYPDALEVLPLLSERGIALVVVSNWDVSLHDVLRGVGLRDVLDGVITSAEIGRPKPDPAIFRAALARMGVSPEQAVHVGDSPEHDVLGALAAGIAPVLVRRQGGHPEDLASDERQAEPLPAVPVISSLRELLALGRGTAL